MEAPGLILVNCCLGVRSTFKNRRHRQDSSGLFAAVAWENFSFDRGQIYLMKIPRYCTVLTIDSAYISMRIALRSEPGTKITQPKPSIKWSERHK